MDELEQEHGPFIFSNESCDQQAPILDYPSEDDRENAIWMIFKVNRTNVSTAPAKKLKKRTNVSMAPKWQMAAQSRAQPT